MMEETLNHSALDLYDVTVRGIFTEVYSARKITSLPNWMEYSNLLLDKFAIHSMSFFHLSKGIVEHKKSGEQKKMYGYDLFTVNTTFRALLETYITFHNLFVEPETTDEAEFRFLMWKLDGLYQKRKYDIDNSDFHNAKEVLEKDNDLISQTQTKIEQTEYGSRLEINQLIKIYKPEIKMANWRFVIENDIIKPKKIIDLVKHVCKQQGFVNLYKYTSLHSHSNFPALVEFQDTRGKIATEQITDPTVKYATIMTFLLINDLCKIDKNAKSIFDSFEGEIKDYINGIVNAAKQSR